ncbi:hypothetical protein [Nodosilinea sp. E11]|uniref:hypothetical protein n=1 Tax=Nodosilinea sp. E11 TaxID=3037479 RepID=UPI0029350471|nr:hypothetical protein [Nodosilinea sp. E11]WOD41670.1 hypothetical protein RRF56_12800 [Nodosilinea sp. E11]
MNLGQRRKRYHSQRGAIGSVPEDTAISLVDLMHQLEGLEGRLNRLKTGIANLLQLQQVEANTPVDDGQAVAQEVIRLQEAADAFELELASQVVSWQHLQESFWQAVRFGGLGIVLGWLLAWLAGI